VHGLRRGEVVALTLDDIIWEGDILHVTRPNQDYSLATAVGNAILHYVVRCDRAAPRARCS
jgi:integrase/recombinase XerD